MAGPVQIGGEIVLSGGLFDVNVRETLGENSSRIVREMAEHGASLVRSGIKPRRPTGFTKGLIEVHQTRAGSLYARIRAKPGEERSPGSATYPSTKRPYIVLAVLESGRRGGHTAYKVRVTSSGARSRKTWVRGSKVQQPLYFFKNAAKALKREAENVRADLLVKGLE